MTHQELVEFVDQLVVVPRVCELCLQHTAVYYDCSIWPDTYVCRGCLEARLTAASAFCTRRYITGPVATYSCC